LLSHGLVISLIGWFSLIIIFIDTNSPFIRTPQERVS
jgi:hypothetical protein